MPRFDDSEFDPWTYANPRAAERLRTFQDMMQPAQALPDGSEAAGPGLDIRSEVNPQAALMDRLQKLQQEQAQLAPKPSSSDPAWTDTINRMVDIESKWNPFAKSKTSSALGLGQFVNDSWLSLLKKVHPEIKGTPEQLLKLRLNPNLSWEMTSALARENQAGLRAAGLQDTAGNLYLAHFAGPNTARRILQADPTTPLEALMSPSAIAANKLAGKTAGQLQAWADSKMASAKPDRASAPGPWPSTVRPLFPSGMNSSTGQETVGIPVRRLRVRPAQ